MLLLFCFGLWVAIPPKLVEQRSTLLLTCSHCCVGRVPRVQWARLDADTLVLIDRSACLAEPCAGDRRIGRSSQSAHGSVSCGASRPMYSSIGRCSQEEIASTSACAPSATVVANSSRARLRAPSTLSVSHLATHVPILNLILPIVTAAAAKLAFLLHLIDDF